MVLAINSVTGVIRDYPINVIQHRVLGRNLEIYVEPVDDEVEEDKVVVDKKIAKRVKLITEDSEVLAAHERIKDIPESYAPAEDLP